ncbi:hypothetical protein SKAU_G00383470 [Synaphobranchus kaupii]|uniref:Translocon-associated protein subunit alpha n=1 Tax=Synaphobranchus kaupii TaxID=118154 RepID=A0A9Q1IEW2_SYNKA|nr:hypothetical protein SKAU_G00383470 [Synaphobranchus kaupii]
MLTPLSFLSRETTFPPTTLSSSCWASAIRATRSLWWSPWTPLSATPQDFQFYIQNFTALQLGIVVPPQRQATFEYSFIPAEPMGGRPFGLVINLNYKDNNGNVFQDAVFNQTVTVTEREDGLDGETIFMYVFLSGLGLLVVVGLHQLLESRKRRRPAAKVEIGTSSYNDVDMSWIPQETLNQIMQSRRDKASPRRSPRKRAQKRSAGSDE